MAEPLDFETTLAARLQARAALAARPFDAAAIAIAAVATRPVRRLSIPWPTVTMRWAVLAGAAILAALAGALLAGALLRAEDTGPMLAVTRSDGVYLAKADGTEPRRLFVTDAESRLAWSADGTLLLVLNRPKADAWRASVLRTDGSVVWTMDGVEWAEWSHVGHRVAWADASHYVITDLDTGATAPPVWSPNNTWSSAWSPDDMRIVVIDTDGRSLVVGQLDGGATVRLTSPDIESLFGPAWSPDGRAIAVAYSPACTSPHPCGWGIAIFDVVTGRKIDGTEPTAQGLPDVQWSPDGTRLAWVEAGTGVVADRLPLGDGGGIRFRGDLLAGWAPDGRSLLVRRSGPDFGDFAPPPKLWRVDVDGSHEVLLLEDAWQTAAQPTP